MTIDERAASPIARFGVDRGPCSDDDAPMGKIAVHEFMSLDGIYEDPTWTFDYGYDPKMAETVATIMEASTAILLGRRTYEMFYPSWSTRTVDDDPGAPFFNDTEKYVISATLDEAPAPGHRRTRPRCSRARRAPRTASTPRRA